MLKLGIGNGSLLKPVAECMGGIGVAVDTETRAAWQEANHKVVGRIFVSRPQHVVTYLELGKIDCALVGQDMLAEHGGYGLPGKGGGWRVFFSFPFSKSSWETNARVVLFTRVEGFGLDRPLDCPQFSILSEYPRLTHWFLDQIEPLSIQAGNMIITPSSGGTEGPVGDGEYEYGVGIMDSGTTLDANNVRVFDVIMEAPVLLVTTTSLLKENPGLDKKIVELGKLFSDALAEKRRGK